MEIVRQNCDERRKKSKKIIQFFKLIAKHWAALAGKTLVPPKNQPKFLMANSYSTKSFGYWMLVLRRIRPTYDKLVLSRSTTDFRMVLGPAFGSRTISCCMGNHDQPLAPEIMNIFNGRPWFDHTALCCKESLNKIFDKKINPKFFFVKFSWKFG